MEPTMHRLIAILTVLVLAACSADGFEIEKIGDVKYADGLTVFGDSIFFYGSRGMYKVENNAVTKVRDFSSHILDLVAVDAHLIIRTLHGSRGHVVHATDGEEFVELARFPVDYTLEIIGVGSSNLALVSAISEDRRLVELYFTNGRRFWRLKSPDLATPKFPLGHFKVCAYRDSLYVTTGDTSDDGMLLKISRDQQQGQRLEIGGPKHVTRPFVLNDKLFFTAKDVTESFHLFAFDGNACHKLAKLSGGRPELIDNRDVLDGNVYFVGEDAESSVIFKTDGTITKTIEVTRSNIKAYPRIHVLDTRRRQVVYSPGPTDICFTDGQTITRRVAAGEVKQIRNAFLIDNEVIFFESWPGAARKLYRSVNNRIQSIGEVENFPSDFFQFGGHVFFTLSARSDGGRDLFSTDGTKFFQYVINPVGSSFPWSGMELTNRIVFEDAVYFAARNPRLGLFRMKVE